MSVAKKVALVLDDDPDMRAMVRKVLETAGMVVVLASAIEEAITLAKKKMPHVVVLDLNLLGDESGFMFLERRRQEKLLSVVPVIVLTSRRDRESIYRAMALGASDYIAKPLNAPLLMQKVRRVFSKKVGYPKKSYLPGQEPQVRVIVPGRVILANETGYVLEAPIRMTGQPNVIVRSKVLDDLGTSQVIYRLSPKGPSPSPEALGQYQMEFYYSGLSESTTARLKKVMQEW